MDIFLSVVALLLVLAAGFGVSLLLMPAGRQTGIIEVGCLSFLFGTGVVSLSSFCLGFVFSGSILRWLVTFVCISLGAIAIRIRQRRGILIELSAPCSMRAILCSVVSLIQVAVVVWITIYSILGWDGLMIWEVKARLAFVNGGSVPISYFSDLAQEWTHHEYPLYLPLTEAWLYAWLGRSDQGLVKLVFPLFYIVAAGLLYTGGVRLSGQKWKGFTAAALLFFVPLVISRGGSVPSGYNDFPLAVFYLASVIYMAEYIDSSARGALRLASGLVALSIWVKPEGVILWFVVLALVMVKALRDRDWKALLTIILPGAVFFGGWKVFLTAVKCPPWALFLPLTPANLWMNLDRVKVLAQWVGSEMINWKTWNILWPVLIFALLSLGKEMRRGKYLSLAASVFLPLLLFVSTYIFTNLQPFLLHVESSLPRLMLSPCLVGVLIVSLGIPAPGKKPTVEYESSMSDSHSPVSLNM